MQHIELAQTLVSLPQKEELEDAEAAAEPMPKRPLVLAGFPLDPGARRRSALQSVASVRSSHSRLCPVSQGLSVESPARPFRGRVGVGVWSDSAAGLGVRICCSTFCCRHELQTQHLPPNTP